MLTPFETLSDQSRIWIYQADKALNPEIQEEIMKQADAFIQSWAAHGQGLMASAIIKHDYFLIIAADEGFQMASGCSIDSSFRFVQELGGNLGINFFERTNLAFRFEGETELVPLNELKGKISAENIEPSTAFFNNTIQTKGELRESWMVEAGKSWLSQYFQPVSNV